MEESNGCQYVMQHKKRHTNLEMTNLGLVIHFTYNFLGASHDGVVCDPNAPEPSGLQEIKSSYMFRDMTPIKAAS